MTAADWHIVRSGHPQVIGSQRQATGDSFQFLPLFRTHLEAESYCRTSGLWHQGIRPRQNSLTAVDNRSPAAGLSILVRQALADGVNAIGVFVGFDTHHQSCWEYFRVSSRTLLIGLYDNLTGRRAEIAYEFDNMHIKIPSGTGPSAEHAEWVLHGTLKIRTRDTGTSPN